MNWIDGIGVRPESTCISRTAPADGAPSRRAQVTRSVFLGNLLQVYTRLDSGEEAIVEIARSNRAFAEGEQVFLHWRAQDEILV